MTNESFDRSKIYEKLKFREQPANYSGKLPWLLQLQIAATNGIQYQGMVGKLNDYPRYNLPVKPVESGLMLDIGTGWGRWLVAAADKGYTPIGLDLRVEFCKAALQTLRAHNKNGYVVAADLKNLPFKNDIFDLIWSFSVIQHTCESRMMDCFNHIHRILKVGKYAYLEFPNKNGIRNRFGPAKKNKSKVDDYNSWHVRYYSLNEYREKLTPIFGNFEYDVHSFLGIGVLPDDLKYLSGKDKIKVFSSLVATRISKMFPFLGEIADSVYIRLHKQKEDSTSISPAYQLHEFHEAEKQNNLDIIPLLRCPVSGSALFATDNREYLVSEKAKIKFPIVEEIPILIPSEAVRVSP